MALRFEQPEWLWGLAALAPMAWALLRWCGTMSLVRRWTAVAVRAALVAVIIGALAGASAVRTTDRLAVLALIDVSGSVRGFSGNVTLPDGPAADAVEAARRWVSAAGARRGPDDLLGVIAFDGQAWLLSTPRPPGGGGDAGSAGGDVGADRAADIPPTDGTDLASALRLALSAYPPDAARRIVLISDGVATSGETLVAAREAAGTGVASAVGGAPGGLRADRVPIDVLPVRYRVEREVSVESVDAPTRAPAGATINVRVGLRSTGPASGRLRLFREGEEIDLGAGPEGMPVRLEAGLASVSIPVALTGERVHRFRAVFEPDRDEGGRSGDTVALNNAGEAITVTPGRGSVLIVDGVGRGDPAGSGAVLWRTLREEGIDARLAPPEGIPSDVLRLQEFDLVILQNVSADSLGERGQAPLLRAVTELGIGLVMVGGPESFAAGGYRGSVLEPILPVRLELPDRLVVPATAVIIVLDCSGSMGFRIMGSSRTQQDVANEGAALAVRSLDKTDLVGVITFDNRAEVVVPLGRNTDSKATAEKIMGIRPEGGTNMPPALEEARRQLRSAEAKVKHIIALTDGVSQGRARLTGIARGLADDGIKLTTIAVGDGADTDGLAAMAEAAGGQYYRVVDPNVLPRVFLRAVRVVRTPLVREEPFVPVVMDPGSPLLDGVIGSGSIPALGGLALTQPRTEPTALLALATETGEPVLASWQAGLGQVAAFTSDAHDHWASDWIGWPGYRALWTRIVRQVSRAGGTGDRAADLTAEVVGDQVRVRLEALDEAGKPLDGLSTPAALYSPRGDREDLRLAAVAPGVYEGVARLPDTGGYVVTVSPSRGGRALAPVVGGFTRPAGAEFRTLESDPDALERIAAFTGGRVLGWESAWAERGRGGGSVVFDRAGIAPREARTPLWPMLLPWALALAVLDVAVRRLAWDRLISRRYGEGLARYAAGMVRDRGASAAATAQRLRSAGETAASRGGDPAGASLALSAEDARRLVIERQRARARAARESAAAPSANATGESGGAAATPIAGPREEGLAAAKRRARERFEREQDQPPAG